MKTITEYRPMIFSELAAQPGQRSIRHKQRWMNGALVVIYSLLGVKLMFDTGLMPWMGQFWLVFAPLLVTGELVVMQFRGRSKSAR